MASLSPSGGMILSTTELVFTQSTISAVGFSSVSWSWSLAEVSPTPSGTEGRNIVISPSGMTLTVSYVSEDLLFPIVTIDYLMNRDSNQRFSVDDFGSIPVDSSDIVKMQEDGKSWCDWVLSVTANGTDTQSTPASASGTYDIRVFANYNTSRDAMIAEVRKRENVSSN